MLTTKERKPAARTLRGWAISILQEAGTIRECEEHGWMKDPADPHARSMLSTSLAKKHQRVYCRSRHPLHSRRYSIRSEIRVPSARQSEALSLFYRVLVDDTSQSLKRAGPASLDRRQTARHWRALIKI
jgi:hypothetical protein